jgi:L-2,4-diaminobutyric acid acetyltransferase
MEVIVDAKVREAAAARRATASAIRLRSPRPEDGSAVSRLIAECPPLDLNSRYCNLLQCDHFAETCVVAEAGDRLAGWISAYRPPSAPADVFVWQVAAHPDFRGQGLGGRMLSELVSRPAVRGASRLIATVTETNLASLSMFAGFARRGGMRLSRAPKYERDRHFEGRHDTEWQISIGPLAAS